MWTTIKTTNIRYGNYDEDKHQKENQFTWRASPSLQAGWLGNRRTANQYGQPSAKDNHQTNSPGAPPSLQAWGNCCCIGVQLSIGVTSPGVHNGRPETYFYKLGDLTGFVLTHIIDCFFLGRWCCTCRWSCGHGCRQGWLWRQDGWGGGRLIFWYGYWSRILLPFFWFKICIDQEFYYQSSDMDTDQEFYCQSSDMDTDQKFYCQSSDLRFA